jgi:hypothetical protein
MAKGAVLTHTLADTRTHTQTHTHAHTRTQREGTPSGIIEKDRHMKA